jgi:DNA end-binding protein Ku
VADEDEPAALGRAFWSGTITFGLVSIPVDLHVALRATRVSLRSLGPSGQPLRRRYRWSAGHRPLSEDEIVRGYPLEDGRHVIN